MLGFIVNKEGKIKARFHQLYQTRSRDGNLKEKSRRRMGPKNADRVELYHGERGREKETLWNHTASTKWPSIRGRPKSEGRPVGKSRWRLEEGLKHYRRIARGHARKAEAETSVVADPEPVEEVVSTETSLTEAPPELQTSLSGLNWVG